MSTGSVTDFEIYAELERICMHQEFQSKQVLQNFLRFIVKEQLEGRGHELKGYTIGVNVFGKDDHFDPEQDSLVRIHAGRLRRQLNLYYLGDGKNDPVIISIPKGSYVPFFERNKNSSSDVIEAVTSPDQFAIEATVGVLPLLNLTGDPGFDYLCYGFSENLSVELTFYEDLSVIHCWDRPAKISNKDLINLVHARFLLDGSIQVIDDQIKILLELIDVASGKQLWASRFHLSRTTINSLQIEDEISDKVAKAIGSETGIIFKKLYSELLKRGPKDPDVFEAVLHFYHYESHISADSALRTFNLLQNAIKKNPESPILMSMLGCMYGNFYVLDYPVNVDACERMNALTTKAREMDPESQMVRIIYLFRCFIKNEKAEFDQELKHCLTLQPMSPFRLGSIGFYQALFGDWESGKVLLDRAMNSGLGFPTFLYGATCLYYFRQKDYDRALMEAEKYEIPGLFWGHLLRIACYGKLKRSRDAFPEIEALLQLKTNFVNEAHELIGRFVKDPYLHDELLNALKLAGLNITSVSSET